MSPLATLMLYLLAGTSLGLLALLSGIPAAPLAGALLGAGIVSMSGQLDQAALANRDTHDSRNRDRHR
jgi:uncharacterized membrane protein AbrB (regulator of aidB expression)